MYLVDKSLPTPDGIYVPTSEHFYMSSRFKRKKDRVAVAQARAEDGDNRIFADGLAAKNLAHEFIDEGRPHYETPYQRVQLMHRAVFTKFVINPRLSYKLLETGGEELVEGNSWGDRFWGVSPAENGTGNNYLGIILMNVREKMEAMSE
ncbi:NADAR family protein [Candidatus Saccharibacteria bacterium]|nr:NADAR family protein [Candidatus Saccharibacteria bacterium]